MTVRASATGSRFRPEGQSDNRQGRKLLEQPGTGYGSLSSAPEGQAVVSQGRQPLDSKEPKGHR